MSAPRSAARRRRKRRALVLHANILVAPALESAKMVERASREWREALWRHGCERVYHWTPMANLPSILTHGLLSRGDLYRAQITLTDHYGFARAYGERDAGARFSSVSLKQPHFGFAGTSSQRGVVLAIAAESVLSERCAFPNSDGGVATDPLEVFDALFRRGSERELWASTTEVLVPSPTPASTIREVWVSPSDAQEARRIVESACLGTPPGVVERALPQPSVQAFDPSVYTFDLSAFAEELRLTEEAHGVDLEERATMLRNHAESVGWTLEIEQSVERGWAVTAVDRDCPPRWLSRAPERAQALALALEAVEAKPLLAHP